jgi:hypothetical protein
MTKQGIYNNIIELLINREWKKHETKTKYDIFIPPLQLNFSETYKLYVYNNFETSDFEKILIKNLEILSQIYNEDIDELASIIIEDRQILSLHIENENIVNARPSIPFFDTIIHKSKELLQEVANFSVIKQAHFFDKREESERYLNYCNFFKNDKGSLITKIQLPNKEEIQESTLFNAGITGSQINTNLIEIASFVNEDIIGFSNYEPDDEFLISNRDFVSVNVTNKLKDLYVGINYADIEISLKSTNQSQSTSIKELNKEKVDNLNRFSKIVREKMKEISEDDFYGKIVQLRSKDVESDKNVIIVESEIKKVKSRIIVQLSSEDYQLAVEAHKTNKTVLIKGI